jgi:NADH-quinone oxidoreductase subunit N
LLLHAGLIFITGTLLFKIACAPFHFWSPDVYDGSPLSSTIIFSIIPKISIIFFLIKWVSCLGLLLVNVKSMLLFCGVLSVFLGTFMAFTQNRLKKLIIYSSIAQVGFIVCILALNNLSSYTSLIFFLIIYLLTSILIWSQIVVFHSFQSLTKTFNQQKISSFFLSSLMNLFKYNSLWSFSLVILFFSIAGIPPLTGFLAKVSIISELTSNSLSFAENYLGLILLILSCFSAFYYIRFIKVTFFEPKLKKNNTNENFQTIYLNIALDKIYVILSTGVFLLVIVFVKPESLFLLSQYIILYSSFY